MLIAPILAVIAYLAVDNHVSEKPQAATSGSTYKLAAKSNCRYQSGACTLKNVDLEITLTAERASASVINLSLDSSRPLTSAHIAEFDGQTEIQPQPMATVNDSTAWHANITVADPAISQLRLVVHIDDVYFYAEVPALFVDYKTSFSRENFANE